MATTTQLKNAKNLTREAPRSPRLRLGAYTLMARMIDSETKAWSAGAEATSPYDDPEKREWFTSECKHLGLDPARTTLFTYLETDDRQTFRK